VTLLVVTAVPPDADAVRAGLPPGAPVDVVAVDAGPAAAAAGTARLLALTPYAGVVCAGIGGGFAGRAPVGCTVVATRTVAADLGAEDGDDYIPLGALGFGVTTYDADRSLVKGLPDAVEGTILTVSTATGSAATAVTLAQRHPDAVAEGMEGFGVASAAATAGVPFGELRTVSNVVGPRDRAAWCIGDALVALTRAATALA
jgi:futalosine hydrolase